MLMLAAAQCQQMVYRICRFTLKYGPVCLQVFAIHHLFSKKEERLE